MGQELRWTGSIEAQREAEEVLRRMRAARRNQKKLQPKQEPPAQTELITWGRHAGTMWSEVPSSYLNWIVETFSEGPRRSDAEQESRRRGIL